MSLFLDPDAAQIEAARSTGATAVELHTGAYAEATARFVGQDELLHLQQMAERVSGLAVQ